MALDPRDLDPGTDMAAFERVRDRLLAAHGSWLSDRGLPADDWIVHQLLQLKWGHVDGHLGRWRVADLEQLLLGLFPAKVVVDDDELARVPPAVGRFLLFLEEAGLLDPGGDDPSRLLDEVGLLDEPFLAAMRDPARFGTAKSLASRMAADGVDPQDPEAVEAWIRAFNALPEDERARRLPPAAGGPTQPRPDLPGEEQLAAEALATPAMAQVAAFVDWLGDGRALTQKGNLKLADGKALVELLGTGDRVDETIGERTFKTRSTTELPGVDLVFRLALKARLARRHRGRVLSTRRARRLAAEPPEVWRDLVEAMVDLGLIGAGREDPYGLRWWAGYLEANALAVLRAVEQAEAGLPVRRLAEVAHERLAEVYDLDSLPEVARAALPRSLAWGAGTLVDRLVWLGVATRDGVVVERDRWGDEQRVGGQLGLTSLGRWFVRPAQLALDGVGVTGGLADASGELLLAALADRPPETLRAEVRAWSAARDTAVAELAEAARGAPTPQLRALAFDALAAVGDEAVPAVRALADDRRLRPWAAFWLTRLGHEPPGVVAADDQPEAVVQQLAVALGAGGSEAAAERLARGRTVGEQLALLAGLWRADDPYTAPVLEALAAAADRPVAKAARKGLFQHRSAGINRR